MTSIKENSIISPLLASFASYNFVGVPPFQNLFRILCIRVKARVKHQGEGIAQN
jgi:hypothetical protein